MVRSSHNLRSLPVPPKEARNKPFFFTGEAIFLANGSFIVSLCSSEDPSRQWLPGPAATRQ